MYRRLSILPVLLAATTVALMGLPSAYAAHEADLGLTLAKTSPNSVKVGDVITYKMGVTNSGPHRADAIAASMEVPAGLRYRDDISEAPCYEDALTSIVTCPLSYLSPNQPPRMITVKFDVLATACMKNVVATAQVRATTFDPQLSNNNASVTTPIACPTGSDLSISLTKTSPTTVKAGDVIVYSAGIVNAGPARANSLDIRTEVPSGLTYRDDLSEAACYLDGNTVRCPLSYLAANQPPRKVIFKFDVGTSLCGADIVTTSTVSASNPDPNTLNNSATLQTPVTCPPPTQDELFITQKATVTTDTAVASQKNISFLRFEARTDNEAILTTDFVFSAAQGSLQNAGNYTLWVDTNNDGIVDTILQNGVSSVSGLVTFDALTAGGYVVSVGQSVVFEVHGDVASSLASNTLQLKFATTNSSYIGAERFSNGTVLSGIKTDGTCATTCETTVTTTAATVWSFVSQGDLFVTQSSTPERNHQLLGGTLGDSILRLQMHAENEDIDVTNLVFTPTGTEATVFSTNVSRLEIYPVGSLTPVALATTATCGTDPVPANSMCARMLSQELIVSKGSNANFLIRPLMKSDVQGSVSGKNIQISVDALAGAKARGLLSSSNLLQNNGNAFAEGEVFIGTVTPAASQTILGKNNVVVHAKITTIINASPDQDGSAIRTGPQQQIGQFKFTAAPASNTQNGNNKFTLSDIIFNVNTTNVATASGSYKIYNKADPFNKAACTVTVVSASQLLATCANLATSAVNTVIDPGTDATFVLEAEVTNAKISNSSSSTLQVSLQNFDSFNNTTFGSSTSHVRWLDKDNVSSTPFLWIEYPDTVINGTMYNA